MPNDQYKIPETAYASSFDEAHHFRYISRSTPDVRQSPFDFIKKIEDRVDSYRDTALELAVLKKRSWNRMVGPLAVSSRPALDRLVDQESHIGGQRAFKDIAGARFWLDKRPERTEGEARDWCFSYPDPLTGELVVLRYQTTSQSIYKLYKGIEYPMTIEEIQNFSRAVAVSVQAIREELYLLDDAIEDDLIGEAMSYEETLPRQYHIKAA